MKLSDPIGNPAWGAFFVRVAVGIFFVLKGLHEIEHAPIAIQTVGVLRNLSHVGVTLLGILIPYLEIAAGTLLLLGFWTVVGAYATSAIALFFVYTVGVREAQLLNRDLVILAASLSLLYTGAGALSLDKMLKSV